MSREEKGGGQKQKRRHRDGELDLSQTNSKAEGLVWVSACIHAHINTGMFRGTEVGPPLGVHGGNVEGDSLEPEHHEQSLGEGAVPNLGPITASLKSNPIPALGPVHGTLPRLYIHTPLSVHRYPYTAVFDKLLP